MVNFPLVFNWDRIMVERNALTIAISQASENSEISIIRTLNLLHFCWILLIHWGYNLKAGDD